MLRLKGHSNVVSIEEITQFDGRPFIVMEYLSGGSLFDLVQRRPLSIAETILVGHQVAAALVAAHRVGIIHRDIKPHNLLINSFGQVKVADFGIAAMVKDAGLSTQTQALTPGYASPEEIDGDEVGPPADVYSLGATLVHLVTGHRPRLLDRVDGHLPFDDRPSLTTLGNELRRCRAHQAGDRPTMAELQAAFEVAQRALGDERLLELVVQTPVGSAVDATTVHRVGQVAAGSTPLVAQPPPPQPTTSSFIVTHREESLPLVGSRARMASPATRTSNPSAPHRRRTVGLLLVTAALMVASGAVVAVEVLQRIGNESVANTQPAGPRLAGTATSSLPQSVPSIIESVTATSATPAQTEAPPPPAILLPPNTTALDLVQSAGRPSEPRGIAVDSTGRLVFSDNHRLVAVQPDGSTVVLAGTTGVGALASPEGVVIVADGSVVFADNGSHRILELSANGMLRVLAGTGQRGFSGDGGRAIDAMLNGPVGVALAPDGAILFADNNNHRVRRIGTDGVISTIAGTGSAALGADGAALGSALNRPQGVAVELDGSVLIADTFNHRVRRLFANGTIVTIAGTGTRGSAGDGGLATAAQLNLPVGVAPLPDGFAVAEYGGARVRVVRNTGTITTLAGTGTPGYSGDGGSAMLAQLNEPQGLIRLPNGRIVITDTGNNRLREIQADGTIVSLLP